MNPSRRKKAAALVILALVGALVVGAAPTGTTQDGPNNYWGPPEFAPAGCQSDPTNWECDTDNPIGSQIEGLTQNAGEGGQNVFYCTGQTCDAEQVGATNQATCDHDASGPAPTKQICNVTQRGGGTPEAPSPAQSNTITADFTATASRSGGLLESITQTSEQLFITKQNGATNVLGVTGEIDHSATSAIPEGVDVPVNHDQASLQFADNDMTATTSNVATYDLDRGQTSNITGGTATQLQDDSDSGNPQFGTFGLGEIDLVADSQGTNRIVIDGTDLKEQNATSLAATQRQGHAAGGWLARLKVDSAQDTEDADVEIGRPQDCSQLANPAVDCRGLVKIWSQDAGSTPAGLRTQEQDDGIKVPIISQSPFDVLSNSFCDLRANEGARIIATQSAEGRAHNDWTGRLGCHLAAGNEIQDPVVPFKGPSIRADLICAVNDTQVGDQCGEGSVIAPAAALDVRNATANETFDGEGATSAQSGNTVAYQLQATNVGTATAEDVVLTAPVPDNTTLQSCPDATGVDCEPAADGKSVRLSFGDIGAGSESPLATFDVTVDPQTQSGTFTGRASGEYGPAGDRGTFQSNETTLTFLAPSSHTHLAVRNVAQPFPGPDSHTWPATAEAERGQTVEYAATFHNQGDGMARNAGVSIPVPAGLTCATNCPVEGSTVTLPLGNVPSGESRTATFQAQVAADAQAGPVTTSATGFDDDEQGLSSGDAVVTIVVPEVPPREIAIDILESTINASRPKNGVANVVINEPAIVASTVCFGDLDEGQCTTGTFLDSGNFDSDPETEIKMKFLIRDTGIDRGDTRACLRGETSSGESVHGCDSISTN